MGTTVRLATPAWGAGRAVRLVADLFRTFERHLSRFDPTSELARVNREAGRPQAVSPLMAEVVALALAAARETDGDFDPTLLPQLVALGYGESFGAFVPGARREGSFASRPGGAWRGIRLEGRRLTLPAGAALDLGGLAKGLAVDRAVAGLIGAGIVPCLVEAGGDLAVAGVPPGGDSWRVALAEAPELVVPLRQGALATSSTLRRRWRLPGGEAHHLLDPKDGLPAASGLSAASVVAPSCAVAEVAAKVALIRGEGRGARFLEDMGLAGVLVGPRGARPVGGVRLLPASAGRT